MIALGSYSLSMMMVTKDSCKVITEIAKDKAVYDEISLGTSKIITFPDGFKTTFQTCLWGDGNMETSLSLGDYPTKLNDMTTGFAATTALKAPDSDVLFLTQYQQTLTQNSKCIAGIKKLMYDMTRGLTPASFDCDECYSDGSPYADGTDQACLWNLQQLFGYNSVFGFKDVWVIQGDQCPEGYTKRHMGNLMAHKTSYTEAGTKNCLVILDAGSYNLDFYPLWNERYRPRMASNPKHEGYEW